VKSERRGGRREGRKGKKIKVSNARPLRLVPPSAYSPTRERTDLMFETVKSSVAERTLVRSRDLALVHAQSSLSD